jgi:hypothetical protein
MTCAFRSVRLRIMLKVAGSATSRTTGRTYLEVYSCLVSSVTHDQKERSAGNQGDRQSL